MLEPLELAHDLLDAVAATVEGAKCLAAVAASAFRGSWEDKETMRWGPLKNAQASDYVLLIGRRRRVADALAARSGAA